MVESSSSGTFHYFHCWRSHSCVSIGGCIRRPTASQRHQKTWPTNASFHPLQQVDPCLTSLVINRFSKRLWHRTIVSICISLARHQRYDRDELVKPLWTRPSLFLRWPLNWEHSSCFSAKMASNKSSLSLNRQWESISFYFADLPAFNKPAFTPLSVTKG